MKKALVFAIVVGLFGSQRALAELKVGDDAPDIFIKHWVKGGEFDMTKAKDKDVIVVEFWATWCGPCKTSIPHMSEMQDHFRDKGVTFIGVSDESKKTVTKFLSADEGRWDKQMRYRVAIDDDDKTIKAWMKAANQQGIPTAFIVQGGKLKWIGHPMDGLGLKVAELAGDEAYAKKEREAQKRREQVMEIMGQFQMANMAEDWEKAVKLVDDALKIEPEDFSLLMSKYHLTATKLKNAKAAATVGREIVSKTDDAQALNALSWTILTDAEFEGVRDLTLAKDAAAKAMNASGEKDPAIIDTYARALADTGDLAGAIQWQKKAVELAEGPMKRELKKSLKEFEERLKKSKA